MGGVLIYRKFGGNKTAAATCMNGSGALPVKVNMLSETSKNGGKKKNKINKKTIVWKLFVCNDNKPTDP